MFGIQQAIGRLAVPVDPNGDASAKLLDDRLEPADCQASGTSALDPCDQRLGGADPLREIDLAPAAPVPQRSDDPTKAHRVHRATMRRKTHRTLTRPEARRPTEQSLYARQG